MAHSLGNIKPKQPNSFDSVKTVSRGKAPAKARPNHLRMPDKNGRRR
jgi:hypothetical protein